MYPNQIRVLTGDEHTFTVGQLSVPRKEEGKTITYTLRAKKKAEISWTKREAEVPPQGQGIPSWNDNQGMYLGDNYLKNRWLAEK